MKQLLLITLLSSIAFTGFFNETSAKDKAEFMENKRLCKLFTQKAKKYKITMRDDFLAETTLASYEHRASLFCKKAEELRSQVLVDTNTTESNRSNETIAQ
jgi:hypothetical protein